MFAVADFQLVCVVANASQGNRATELSGHAFATNLSSQSQASLPMTLNVESYFISTCCIEMQTFPLHSRTNDMSEEQLQRT